MSEITYKTVPTRHGLRLVQHGTVLSEVRTSPGPTHSVADVIAATTFAVRQGPRIALLGFAGGGMLAPLRAMGCWHPVDAVDLDPSGWTLFQRHCRLWAGEVMFKEAEAESWLSNTTRQYGILIEDLSVPEGGDVFKPAATWSGLPRAIYSRLAKDGVAVFNLLPPRDGSWHDGYKRIVLRESAARVIEFEDYENRLLVVGRRLPTARSLSRTVRMHLRGIRSRLARRISVSTYATRPPV